MADNYLERKMDEMRSGRTVIRKDNPSLDTLLHRLGGFCLSDSAGPDTGRPDAGGAGEGSVEKVRMAQLEAALRSASYLGIEFESAISDERQSVTISGCGRFEMGAVALAIRLKASELGLKTEFAPVRADFLEIFFSHR